MALPILGSNVAGLIRAWRFCTVKVSRESANGALLPLRARRARGWETGPRQLLDSVGLLGYLISKQVTHSYPLKVQGFSSYSIKSLRERPVLEMPVDLLRDIPWD